MKRKRVNCLECASRMNVASEPHRYGGDLGVILSNVEIRRCPSCGQEEVVIPNIEQLHRIIARAIAQKAGALGPAEIRFLRTWLGYSSVDFSRLLGVRPETVSRWESAREPQRMSRSAEKLLRVLVECRDPIQDYGLEERLLEEQQEAGPAAVRLKEKNGEWSVAAA